MTSFIEIAAPWIALGANVLPILPGAKSPAVAGWGGANHRHSKDSARYDGATYVEWATAYAECNVAVLPATIDATVIDVDDLDMLDRVIEACGPTDYRTISGREGGGVHLWYRGATGSRNRLAPGVDVKSTGGYVIAPGSLHARSGQRYTASAALAAGLAVAKLDLPPMRDGWRAAVGAIRIDRDPSRLDLQMFAGRLQSSPARRPLGNVLKTIAEGEAFAVPGERETTLWTALKAMFGEWPSASADSIVALFERSAKAMEAAHPVEITIEQQVRSKWARLTREVERSSAAPVEARDDDDDTRPVVSLGGDDRRVLTAIADALRDADAATASGLMLQGSALVVHDPRSGTIVPASADRIAVALADAIAFTRDGDPCGVSRELAGKFAARPPELPALVEVRNAPVLRPDGSVRRETGLDAATGVWCGGWPVPVVAGARADAAAAIGRIFRFVDAGHWESAADAIAWLAHVLTVAARPAIDGPVPTWIYTAPVSGSGKTALARTAGIIGGRADGFAAPGDLRDEAELARLLDGHAGSPACVLDNLHGTFRSPLLEAVVTGGGGLPVRRLYVGPVVVPWRCVLSVSSNGATVGGDWARRSLGVRLTGRKLDGARDIVAEARDRADLTDDAVAAVAAWLASGEASSATPLLGFGAWSSVVAGCIRWALGEAYDVVPLTREAAADLVAADDDGGELLDRIEAWLAGRSADAFRAADLWGAPAFGDITIELGSIKALGNRLLRLADSRRVLARRRDAHAKVWVYYVPASVGSAGVAGGCGSSLLTPWRETHTVCVSAQGVCRYPPRSPASPAAEPQNMRNVTGSARWDASEGRDRACADPSGAPNM